jgi:hypothetical protein
MGNGQGDRRQKTGEYESNSGCPPRNYQLPITNYQLPLSGKIMMNLRNLARTYNYLNPQQKIATAIAAIVGGGVLICIPLLSLQPPRPPVAFEGRSSKTPIGGQNPSEGDDFAPSSAKPLDTANPVDLFSDSSGIGTVPGSDSLTSSGSSTDALSGENDSTKLDTTDTPDERGLNRQRSSASMNDTLSNNTDNPYSQSTISRYNTPASISNSPYSASPGSSGLSTPYSRSSANGLNSSMSKSSNLEPAKGNNFTYLNPFSPNNATGTAGANPNATSFPGNASVIPSQSAIAPSGLSGTSEGGMNPPPGYSGSSGGFPSSTTSSPAAPDPTSQNSTPSPTTGSRE